jgi:transposase
MCAEYDERYVKNFETYSEDAQYADYWKEREKTPTVQEILSNYEQIPLSYSKNILDVLHKKRSERKGRKR